MFVINEDARDQLKIYTALCAQSFIEKKNTHIENDFPATEGILAEKFGVLITFLVNGKSAYASGILVAKDSLQHNIAMIYKKASAAIQRSENTLVSSTMLLASPPLSCQSLDDIVLGRHGIILTSRGRSQYLLPETPVQNGWTKLGALENLCRALALPPGTWRDKTARILTFETAVV